MDFADGDVDDRHMRMVNRPASVRWTSEMAETIGPVDFIDGAGQSFRQCFSGAFVDGIFVIATLDPPNDTEGNVRDLAQFLARDAIQLTQIC